MSTEEPGGRSVWLVSDKLAKSTLQKKITVYGDKSSMSKAVRENYAVERFLEDPEQQLAAEGHRLATLQHSVNRLSENQNQLSSFFLKLPGFPLPDFDDAPFVDQVTSFISELSAKTEGVISVNQSLGKQLQAEREKLLIREREVRLLQDEIEGKKAVNKSLREEINQLRGRLKKRYETIAADGEQPSEEPTVTSPPFRDGGIIGDDESMQFTDERRLRSKTEGWVKQNYPSCRDSAEREGKRKGDDPTWQKDKEWILRLKGCPSCGSGAEAADEHRVGCSKVNTYKVKGEERQSCQLENSALAPETWNWLAELVADHTNFAKEKQELMDKLLQYTTAERGGADAIGELEERAKLWRKIALEAWEEVGRLLARGRNGDADPAVDLASSILKKRLQEAENGHEADTKEHRPAELHALINAAELLESVEDATGGISWDELKEALEPILS